MKWYVVKYVPDLFRREPRNVGIIAFDGTEVVWQFLGQSEPNPLDLEIDARMAKSVVTSVRNYRAWVKFFRNAVVHGDVGLSRFQAGGNYSVEVGGEVLRSDQKPLLEFTAELFDRFVGDFSKPRTIGPKDRALQLFDELGVGDKVVADYVIKGPSSMAHFDFHFKNGRNHVMNVVTIGKGSGGDWRQAQSARFAFDQAANDIEGFNPIALWNWNTDEQTTAQEEAYQMVAEAALVIELDNPHAQALLATEFGLR